MPSSYSVNLLLELMADGENSGLWGDITNDNLEILGRAISGVTTLSLSGTTTTLTTLQGTLSEGHFAVLELGGSPTGTNTITISPNTIDRVYLVKNGSGQDALFTQGSGGNVTVPNGRSAIIFCDGAGATAKVTELTEDFLRGANNLSDVADAPTALTNLGITATAAEINVLDGATLDISAVTATAAEVNVLDGITATTAELNILDGVTATAAEINVLDGITATTAELNILDGVTATAAEVNVLDGITATTAELNILDGVTATAAEINILDGVTATTAELNTLDGITATTAELNTTDGVTSPIQAQLDALDTLITDRGVPAGAVQAFARNTAPTSWLKADGAAVSRTTYATLFAAIGTTFGAGDGSTTFNLPDLRGEFLRGWDDGRGVDSGRIFGSAQGDAIRNITGVITDIRVRLNGIFTASGAFSGVTGATSGDANAGSAPTADFTFDASQQVPTAGENRPRNMALLYCIKT